MGFKGVLKKHFKVLLWTIVSKFSKTNKQTNKQKTVTINKITITLPIQFNTYVYCCWAIKYKSLSLEVNYYSEKFTVFGSKLNSHFKGILGSCKLLFFFYEKSNSHRRLNRSKFHLTVLGGWIIRKLCILMYLWQTLNYF